MFSETLGRLTARFLFDILFLEIADQFIERCGLFGQAPEPLSRLALGCERNDFLLPRLLD